MSPPRWWFRSGRAVAALCLVATFIVGELADARHHLSDHGCASDTQSPGRDDHCTCAGLHVAPLAAHAPVALDAPVLACQWSVPGFVSRPRSHATTACIPRAPPRG